MKFDKGDDHMEKERKKEISRRDFMKTTIPGVGGLIDALIGLPAIASPCPHAALMTISS
jgi:hypothetical protein